MKTKLCMVDLDGTLFNTNKVNYLSYKKALNEYNYDLTYEYYCEYCNGRSYKEFLSVICKDDNNIIEAVHQRKIELYQDFINEADANVTLIDYLKSIKQDSYISLITTASSKNCNELIDYFKIKDLFDLIITKDNVKHIKPNPEAYNLAIDYFKVDKSNCEVYEDSKIGIQAAKNAGIKINIVKGYN